MFRCCSSSHSLFGGCCHSRSHARHGNDSKEPCGSNQKLENEQKKMKTYATRNMQLVSKQRNNAKLGRDSSFATATKTLSASKPILETAVRTLPATFFPLAAVVSLDGSASLFQKGSISRGFWETGDLPCTF